MTEIITPPPEVKRSWAATISAFAMTLIGVSVLFSWILWLWPINVIEIKSIKILTPIVVAGKDAEWEIEYCKFYDVPGSAYRELRDDKGRVWLSATAYGINPPGCGTSVVSMPVPLSATPGSYYVHSTTDYAVFGSKHFILHFSTPNFEVTAPEVVPVVLTQGELTTQK